MIRCNLTKTCQIFVTFTGSFYRNMRIIYAKYQEYSPVYRRIMRSSIPLYVRSIEFYNGLKKKTKKLQLISF